MIMIINVQQTEDGECFIQLPAEILDAASLAEGDTIEWIDRGDGSFEIKKVEKK